MFSQRGHLTLLTTMVGCGRWWRAEVNSYGCRLGVIGPTRQGLGAVPGTRRPTRDTRSRRPYHPPGGTIRHDAVNVDARAADALVWRSTDPRCRHHRARRGGPWGVAPLAARFRPVVVNDGRGSSLVVALGRRPLPITPTHCRRRSPSRCSVLKTVVVSGTAARLRRQRPEANWLRASTDPYPSYSMRGFAEFTE